MRRVVSLVPSVTETLLAWGVTPVAVTRFCEAPGIPTVGGTKNPDLAAIVALRPDVVFMDKEENRAADADSLTEAGVEVVATAVRSVGDVAPALAVLAEAAGAPPPAGPSTAPAGPSTAPAGPSTAPAGPSTAPAGPPRARGPLPAEAVRVFVPIWRRPWMTVGAHTYGSSLLSASGFDHIYRADPDPYPEVALDEAASRAPVAVLAPSEPYEFKEKHRPELERVAPVVFVDGRDLFWWGARTPAALERLRRMATRLAGA